MTFSFLVKALITVLAISFFYHIDAAVMVEEVAITWWIPCLLGSLLIMGLAVKAGGRALAFFASLPGRNSKIGVLALASSLLLYALGSYSPSPLWLHFLSLPLFTVGIMSLLFDGRVLKFLSPALVTMALVVPPPVQTIPFALPTAFVLSAASARYLVPKIRGQMGAGSVASLQPCDECLGGSWQGSVVCLRCGRLLSARESSLTKGDVGRLAGAFLTLALVTMVALLVFAYADDSPVIRTYSIRGYKDEPLASPGASWNTVESGSEIDFTLNGFLGGVVQRWSSAAELTQGISVVGQLYARFGDYAIAGLGVMAMAGLARYARRRDEVIERRAEAALNLSREECLLLVSMASSSRAGNWATGSQAVANHRLLTGKPVGDLEVIEKLQALERLDLAGRHIETSGSEPVVVWRSRVPLS